SRADAELGEVLIWNAVGIERLAGSVCVVAIGDDRLEYVWRYVWRSGVGDDRSPWLLDGGVLRLRFRQRYDQAVVVRHILMCMYEKAARTRGHERPQWSSTAPARTIARR